jgi:hypothetical protein
MQAQLVGFAVIFYVINLSLKTTQLVINTQIKHPISEEAGCLL